MYIKFNNAIITFDNIDGVAIFATYINDNIRQIGFGSDLSGAVLDAIGVPDDALPWQHLDKLEIYLRSKLLDGMPLEAETTQQTTRDFWADLFATDDQDSTNHD